MPVADPSLPLQKGIVAALKADAGVNALAGGRIYDGVPLNAVKPYISFGPFQVLPEAGDCLDGAAATIQLDGWSTGPSTVQAKQLGTAIAAALDEASFALDAPHVLVDLAVDDIQYLREPDGITAHTIVTLTARTEPRDDGDEPPPLPAGQRHIDGGPNYFAQFSHSLPSTPDYFPIGVWLESVIDSNADLDPACGLNLYVGLTADSDLGRVQAMGMRAILNQFDWNTPAAIAHAAMCAWLLYDEVDMAEGPSTGYDTLNEILALLPNDNRFRYNNYGKGVIFWETDAEAERFVNDFQHVVSTDIYWFTDPNCHTVGEGGKLFGLGRDLTYDETRRASNYGATVDRTRALDLVDGVRRPVWAFIEVGWPFTETEAQGSRQILPQEIVAAVWHSIIAGARGIIYFNHAFGGPNISAHCLRDTPWAAQRAAVQNVNGRIASLAAVLNAPFDDLFVTASAAVRAMAKIHDGKYYVFAGSKENVASTATFTLTGVSDGIATVLFETRSIPIVGGSFTDNFADGNVVHIYRIDAALAPSTTWDAATKHSNITLSNGDLTATAGVVQEIGAPVRGTLSRNTGKHYFEIELDADSANASFASMAGLCNTDFSMGATEWLGNGTARSIGVTTKLFGGNNIWFGTSGVGGGNVGATPTPWTDRLGIAVDLDARKVWFTANGIAWGPSGDPATGAGGVDITTITGALYPVAQLKDAGDAMTAHFAASSLLLPVPAGFAPWDSGVAALASPHRLALAAK